MDHIAVTLEKLPPLPNGIRLFEFGGITVFPLCIGNEPTGKLVAFLVKISPSGKATNYPIEILSDDSCEILYEKLKTAIAKFAAQEIA